MIQVNFSDFYSNSLSCKWQPPADFSDHLPETTTFLDSSNFYTSTEELLKTINMITIIYYLLVRVKSAVTSSLDMEGMIIKGPYVGW